MPEIPFDVGSKYTRADVYELLNVPEDRRRGNWETGYTRWGDDLFIFSTVGSAATGGFDYDNHWEGDQFVWYAKSGTNLRQPQIQWMLHDSDRVFLFTRPAVRHPFVFEGLATPVESQDTSPVMVRWKVDRDLTRPAGDSVGFGTPPLDDPTQLQQYARRVRRGQPEFRRQLLRAYGGRCSITGHGPEAVLQAAHIASHAATGINNIANGLLLRSDIHDLFDDGLLRIDPDKLCIVIDESIKDTPYGEFHGRTLRPRVDGSQPSSEYLRTKWGEGQHV